MTEGLVPDADLALLDPDTVSPAMLFLTSTDAPSRVVMGAGAGAFSVVHVLETAGVWLPKAERTAEGLARRFTEIAALSGAAPWGQPSTRPPRSWPWRGQQGQIGPPRLSSRTLPR